MTKRKRSGNVKVTKKEKDETLNNNIEKYRKPLGLSQYRLAKKAEVTRKSINFIETGKVVPNLLTAAKIARALGVSID